MNTGSIPVTVQDRRQRFPTYRPAAPDRNPMFLERRVYQGSSGRVYPLPFIDRIAEVAVEQDWSTITLENEFLEVMILPELGGRIHRLRDKTQGYDTIYYQPVIKPALVGLAGPWISGGIEFNWPQHHRPSTFMPAEVAIERATDGSVTVWLSEHDPMSRMKGMHGVRLRPGCSVLELRVRAFNRTDDVQTFLWWANVATEVHEQYQSFFPPDVTFVADHAKRAMSTFPLCSERYYGVDYGERARRGVPEAERPRQFVPDGSYPANDLTWYANIPVPTSYMCMGTHECFFGGYDHRAQAGIVHVADPHISPGKKQWTWGNHEFGYAWDRLLTDADDRGIHRPYIELMAGVYTDNQPDFSFLQPGETKSWTQYWYPIRAIGPVDQANTEIAVSLRIEKSHIRIGVHATVPRKAVRIVVEHRGRTRAKFTRDIGPSSPLVENIRTQRPIKVHDLVLMVMDADGRVLLRHAPRAPARPPSPEALGRLAATEPPPPAAIPSADELFFTGLHLEQYRHATRFPSDYWNEALRRDAGDARCNLALGRWLLRRGEFGAAESHLRAAVARQTLRNPNPADGEALYQLGRTLRFLRRDDEAYSAFSKAAWNQGWASASHHALAEIDCSRDRWSEALDHLNRCLRLDADNLRARALKAMALRRLERDKEASRLIEEALALDPLDPWMRLLARQPWCGNNAVRLDVAFDLSRAGVLDEALALLQGADSGATDGSMPMIEYARAMLLDRRGDERGAARARRHAQAQAPDYCFPSRLDELLALEAAVTADPADARAHMYLGHLLYDRRRRHEAIAHWEAAVRHEPRQSVAWRCLGVAYFNVLKKPAKARTAFARARAAAPDEARLLFESDQLAKRLGAVPARRLRDLETHRHLVTRRDDLTVELCALYNQTGRAADALKTLTSRLFQPWEGGEGMALGQHVRTHLRLGREALARNDTPCALNHFESALRPPPNLGETRHLLANQSDVFFWLGEARAAGGDRSGARRAWRTAAEFKGDFQDMSVRAFSEMTYFSAMALRRLGRLGSALRLLRDLLSYARALEKKPATMDYFATSLPTMLLFEDDIQFRQVTTARFLQAQALLGLGRRSAARRLLAEVLGRDPNHAHAADLVDPGDRANRTEPGTGDQTRAPNAIPE